MRRPRGPGGCAVNAGVFLAVLLLVVVGLTAMCVVAG